MTSTAPWFVVFRAFSPQVFMTGSMAWHILSPDNIDAPLPVQGNDASGEGVNLKASGSRAFKDLSQPTAQVTPSGLSAGKYPGSYTKKIENTSDMQECANICLNYRQDAVILKRNLQGSCHYWTFDLGSVVDNCELHLIVTHTLNPKLKSGPYISGIGDKEYTDIKEGPYSDITFTTFEEYLYNGTTNPLRRNPISNLEECQFLCQEWYHLHQSVGDSCVAWTFTTNVSAGGSNKCSLLRSIDGVRQASGNEFSGLNNPAMR